MCYWSLDQESTTQTQIQLGLVWVIGPEPQLKTGLGLGLDPFTAMVPIQINLK